MWFVFFCFVLFSCFFVFFFLEEGSRKKEERREKRRWAEDVVMDILEGRKKTRAGFDYVGIFFVMA